MLLEADWIVPISEPPIAGGAVLVADGAIGAVGVAGANDTYACPSCGGSFTFATGEAKLKDVGELDKLKEKLDRHDADLDELKKRLPASSSAADPPADPDEGPSETEPAGYGDDDEEDL
mgnify:CR=1 FL=1